MLAIFSDSKIYAGVEVIIARFSAYLKAKNVRFCVLEPEGTILFRELKEMGGVKVVPPSRISDIAGGIESLFLPSVSKLRNEIFLNCKTRLPQANLFTWVVHPHDAFICYFPFVGRVMDIWGYRVPNKWKEIFPQHYERVLSLMRLLCDEKGLAVMDGATSRTLRYFYPELQTSSSPLLIPVPTLVSEGFKSKRLRGEELSIGYLGRLDNFKYSALGSFVEGHLIPYARKNKIELHVVSTGTHLSRLREICCSTGIALIEHGFLPNEEAKRTICERTDLSVAMGTSALDLAASSHPCIIIDPALEARTKVQSRFHFVSEIKDFTLGEYRDFPGYEEYGRSFLEVLTSLDRSVGEDGRDYVKKNHDAEVIFASVLNAIRDSTLSVQEAVELVRKIQGAPFARLERSARAIKWSLLR